MKYIITESKIEKIILKYMDSIKEEFNGIKSIDVEYIKEKDVYIVDVYFYWRFDGDVEAEMDALYERLKNTFHGIKLIMHVKYD